MHLVTYATHVEGTLAQLVSAHPTLRVLGFGRPWRGYFDKVVAMAEYLETLDAADVVLFVDGFDVNVERTDAVESYFAHHSDVDVLFAKHVPPFHVPFVTAYVVRRQFGGTINSGVYAGRAAALRTLCAEALRRREQCHEDDQRAFNVVTASGALGTRWRVDEARDLFEVRSWGAHAAPSRACVVHTPGTGSWWRVFRGVWEIAWVLRYEVLLVSLCFVVVLT